MRELYKGYILTNGKKPKEAIEGRTEFKTYEDVKAAPEYAGMLADDVVLIDVDDLKQSEILLKIVEDEQLDCRVYETKRGMHFVFLNDGIKKCGTKVKLACGIKADIKVGGKNTYEVLKIDGMKRVVIYDINDDEDYEKPLPKYLLPVRSKYNFVGMTDNDGRNSALYSYILTLKSNGFSNDEARNTITIINKYIFAEPLDDDELNTILRDESFPEETFYDGKKFMHEKFAQYLVNNNHIVRMDDRLHIYQDGIYKDGSLFLERAIIGYIPNTKSAMRTEIIKYVELQVLDNIKPSDANFIGFKNGIYNVANNSLQAFSPDIILTNQIPHDYNPAAYSEAADKVLDKLACGDNKIRLLLEECIGYCFYRRNELRKAFILIGDKSNGKSTYLDMINFVLGENNIATLDISELDKEYNTAELYGKLANIGDDICDDFIKNPAILKKVISGDTLKARHIYEKPFSFKNYAKMLFSANTIPRIKDKTGAVLDRLIIVPFNATFSADDPDYDPYIKYKLHTEETAEYLIKLGIEGLKRVLENRGFTVSERVSNELKEYELSNNPILQFFNEIDENEILNEPTKDVYRKYNEFCITNGYKPISNIEFSRQIAKHYGYGTKPKRVQGQLFRIFVKKELQDE